ncbi:MAG: biotin--[acetyl-CoA-carboxylase] ligase [Planctomycetota bacterium]|nr:biotin--[acetyl-CoA-carboxylase] ligase [Planctomycetota bacterium]
MDVRLSLALRERRSRPVFAEELGAALALAPQRLAREIDELSRRGFVIENNPVLGLRLVGVPASLIEEELAHGMAARRVGRRIRCVESAASTNDLAWEAAARGREESDGLAVLAEYQTGGRGRRGNRWLAPPHSSILISVVVWLADAPSRAGVLTRASALAAARAIEGASAADVGIKWPNDLVIDDRKVGGILVEARPVAGEVGRVVIGIGINCTQGPEAFPEEIRPTVASLGMLGEQPDRTVLARLLLVRLDEVFGRLADPDGADAIARDAAARCRTLGRRITVQEGGAAYTGEVVDLDADYGLVLRLREGGGLRTFPAMTTHVVG